MRSFPVAPRSCQLTRTNEQWFEYGLPTVPIASRRLIILCSWSRMLPNRSRCASSFLLSAEPWRVPWTRPGHFSWARTSQCWSAPLPPFGRDASGLAATTVTYSSPRTLISSAWTVGGRQHPPGPQSQGHSSARSDSFRLTSSTHKTRAPQITPQAFRQVSAPLQGPTSKWPPRLHPACCVARCCHLRLSPCSAPAGWPPSGELLELACEALQNRLAVNRHWRSTLTLFARLFV
mmetsp:Transcript_56808/g.158180  ORF Transcript_56808/g.158180 Transcript_56808/m.158180 type:complete len:234 (+) Transcript_56808:436-1137(+)